MKASLTLCSVGLTLFGFVIFVTPLKADHPNLPNVGAAVSTQPVGEADGVAIWRNPAAPAKSTVIGALPGQGLAVFNLKGELIQKIRFPKAGAGEVDVREGFPLGNDTISLVAGGVKNGYLIYAYRVVPATGKLQSVLPEKPIATVVNPYGSCLYHSKKSGKFYLFITSKSGDIEQYHLSDDGAGKLAAKRVRTIHHRQLGNPVIEACVCDDESGWLFISQENECKIWRYDAEPDGDTDSPFLVDMARIAPGDNVEGLAIVPTGVGSGYLIASIQGSWTYKVYDRRPPHKLISSFQVSTPRTPSGKSLLVTSHDCIEATNANLGPAFPHGLFVTQDASGTQGPRYEFVPWKMITDSIETKK